MEISKLVPLGLVALVLALVGCGDDNDGSNGSSSDGGAQQGTLSSCDLTAHAGYCLDYAATAPAGIAQESCDVWKRTFQQSGIVKTDAPCSTANRIGTCVAVVRGVTTAYQYYAGQWDAAMAQVNCKHVGGTGGVPGVFTLKP